MQLLAGLSHSLNQVRLHKAVDILVLIVDDQPSRLHILPNAGETFDQHVPLLGCQDPLLGQHHHMSDTALDILLIKLLVKINGRIKRIDLPVRVFGKAPSP